MPWSGGTFTRSNGVNSGATTWATDAAAGVNIVDTRHDTHDQDLATGINQCLNKDGSNYADAINIGHATDTTITRVSAGVIAVEGVTVATTAAGSFTGTLTGMSGATTGTVKYRVTGNIAYVWVESGITGTSNTTAMTMTGMPAAARPGFTVAPVSCNNIVDNGNNFVGGAGVATGGTITFSLLRSSGSNYITNDAVFTGSGTKGLQAGWSISYPLS